MKTKENKSAKKYDAVKEMRKIRDRISLEIAGMNAEQMIAYFKSRKFSGQKAK